MADFPTKAHALLTERRLQAFRGGKETVVNLILQVTRSPDVEDEIRELRGLQQRLEGLQDEFVRDHREACDGAMQSFMHLVRDLDEARGIVQGLKEHALGLRGSMGKYSADLVAAYKRRERNKYLLHALRVVQEVAQLDARKAQHVRVREYLACAHALRQAHIVYEQWPVTRDAARSQMQLPLLYGQLTNLLSPPKLRVVVDAIHATVFSCLLPTHTLKHPDAFAALVDRERDGTRGGGGRKAMEHHHHHKHTHHHTAAKTRCNGVHVNVSVEGGEGRSAAVPRYEVVALHEGTRVWHDDYPIATGVSAALLDARLLRGPRVLPAGTTVTLHVHGGKADVYVGAQEDADGGVLVGLTSPACHSHPPTPGAPQWRLVPSFSWKMYGDSRANGNADAAPPPPPHPRRASTTAAAGDYDAGEPNAKWIFARGTVAETDVVRLAANAGDARGVVVIVVPHAADGTARTLEECVAALHVMGSVGTVPVGTHQRVADLLAFVSDGGHLRKRLSDHLDALLTAFGAWWDRERRSTPTGVVLDSLAAALRGGGPSGDLSLSGGTTAGASSNDAFHLEQRLHALQHPVVRQLFAAIYSECNQLLRYFVDLTASAKQHCVHGGTQTGAFAPEYCTFDADALEYVSEKLWTFKEVLPEAPAFPASKICEDAVRLLEKEDGGYALRRLIGTRRTEGWLRKPPPRRVAITIPNIPKNERRAAGIDLSVDAEVTGVARDSPAAQYGVARVVGYTVATVVVAPPRGEAAPRDQQPSPQPVADNNTTGATAARTHVVAKREDVYEAFAAARDGGGEVVITFEKTCRPPVVGHALVRGAVEGACKHVARGLAATSTDAEEAAYLLVKTVNALVGVHTREFGKRMHLDKCVAVWAEVQGTLAPLIIQVCSAGRGGGFSMAASRSAGAAAPGHSGSSLSDILKRAGQDLPRLFDGAPGLTFAFSDVLCDDDERAQHVGLDVARHVTPMPLNALVLYRMTVDFEAAARAAFGDAVPCTLATAVQDLVKRDLLPRLRDHFLLSARGALNYPNPTALPAPAETGAVGAAGTRAHDDRRPILDAMLASARAMHLWLAVPVALPFARDTVLDDLASMLSYVHQRSLSQLKERVQGTLAGVTGVGILDTLLAMVTQKYAGGSGSGGPALDKAQETLWRSLSTPYHPEPMATASAAARAGETNELVLIANLIAQQPRGSVGYLRSSQDLSFVASLVHSAEWLADQVKLVCDATSTDATTPHDAAVDGAAEAFETDNTLLLADTACYSSIVPGMTAAPAPGDPEYMAGNRCDSGVGTPTDASASGISMPTVHLQQHQQQADLIHIPHAARLPTNKLSEVYTKLMLLARGAFVVLEIDLIVRTACLLDSRGASYNHECDTTEPDEFIETFNRDIRRLYVTYREYLPSAKQIYLTQYYPLVVSFNLIRGIALLKNKHVTDFGVGRLRRNVFALQQNLALLVTDVAQSDEAFVRVRRYYEFLTLTPAELVERRAELDDMGVVYSEHEFMAAEEVVKRGCLA